MTARTSCCVPGCRASTGRPFAEWVCTKHWRMVPKESKAAYYRAKRLWRRGQKSYAATLRLWERCKRIATERNFTEMMP